MTEIADRYARLSQAFDATVRGVAPDGWDVPTPCPDWTARKLVEHVANNPGLFLGLIGEPAPELPPVSEDPAATWRVSDAYFQDVLHDPSRANKEFDGFFGRSTLAKGTDIFLSFDLVVHRWDLARATGQDERIPDEEIDQLYAAAAGFGPAMRSSRAFGPALETPDDADRQTKLLAFLGRQA